MENEMLIYRSADGNIKIDVRMGEETVWLTQQRTLEKHLFRG